MKRDEKEKTRKDYTVTIAVERRRDLQFIGRLNHRI